MLGCGKHELAHGDTTACDALIRSKLHLIMQSVDEDEEMNLEYFLGLCRTIVLRHGARVIVLDPWNELEHRMRQGESETFYIGRALRAVLRFASIYDVAFWIVAHPTKPFEGKQKMPTLYDISGSANWANKPDFGLSYHRGPNNTAELCVTIRAAAEASRLHTTTAFHASSKPHKPQHEQSGEEIDGQSRAKVRRSRLPIHMLGHRPWAYRDRPRGGCLCKRYHDGQAEWLAVRVNESHVSMRPLAWRDRSCRPFRRRGEALRPSTSPIIRTAISGTW